MSIITLITISLGDGNQGAHWLSRSYSAGKQPKVRSGICTCKENLRHIFRLRCLKHSAYLTMISLFSLISVKSTISRTSLKTLSPKPIKVWRSSESPWTLICKYQKPEKNNKWSVVIVFYWCFELKWKQKQHPFCCVIKRDALGQCWCFYKFIEHQV